MILKNFENKTIIRNIEQTSWKQKICSIFLAIIMGSIFGILAKLVDNTTINPIFDDIGGRLGIWVFIATLLAVYASSPSVAAIRVFAFFLSMLFVYYTYTIYFLHFFPKHQIIFWSLCALITPICAYIMWFARGRSLFSDFCAAIPIAVISSESYLSCKSDLLLQGIYLCWVIVLMVLLPRNSKHYICVCIISLMLFWLLIQTRLLSSLFGGWNTKLYV